ncbi:hypothetical protein Y699_08389 [Aspergillus fumigatus Z5]|nr:hypothetical protein Y699_08389 [Aspergillus fumigatus Z5]
MTFNITIDPSRRGSDSSLSDEEDSSGVQVSPPSESGSHEYHDPYDEWAHLPYPDELKPSDSASRPRASIRTRNRNSTHGSSSGPSRRHSARRHVMPERESFVRRSRRQPSPDSPESLDSAEEYATPYGRTSHERRLWPPMTQGSNYAHSTSPGPSYVYPNSGISPGAFAHSGLHPPSDQLVRLSHHQTGHSAAYSHPIYGYGPQYQHPHGPPLPAFFMHEHHPGHHMPQVHPSGQGRSDGHSPPQQSTPHAVPPHGPSHYGGNPLGPHELIPYGPGGYFPFREPYPMVPGMVPPPYLNTYPRVPSPSQGESSPSPVPAAAEVAKDEAIARLEKLILEERTEREAKEAREAALRAAIEKEAAEQAAREERAAHEKKLVEEAAAAARAEAEQKAAEEAAKAKKEAEEAAAAARAEAEQKAAEEAAKLKKEAEEAVAAATAAATAAANKVPEKKKPIKFKDAVGRKFSFPFDLCCTWQGMEELIRQAFLHIEVIGPHVAEGHYDLVGPNGDIILPQVWETVIEPDWTITMHMWPIPEKPKSPGPAEGGTAPEGQATAETAPGSADSTVIVAPDDSKKKPEPAASTKKPRAKGPDPGAFAMWMSWLVLCWIYARSSVVPRLPGSPTTYWDTRLPYRGLL